MRCELWTSSSNKKKNECVRNTVVDAEVGDFRMQGRGGVGSVQLAAIRDHVRACSYQGPKIKEKNQILWGQPHVRRTLHTGFEYFLLYIFFCLSFMCFLK